MQIISILLVDDETRFRETLAKRMKKRGFFVRQAGDGPQCLAILAQRPAHVVVLDVKMPGMDGIAVLQTIKRQYPEIEVILLTGHSTTSDGVHGMKAGAFDYLGKPVEFDHLIGKISQAVEIIQSREEKAREADLRVKMEHQMVAADRLAALGTLATGVAHEINNPLAIIKEAAGWMRLILEKEPQLTRRQDLENALKKVQGSIERARRITHQLLTFVKKADTAFVETDVAELVAETIDLLRGEITDYDVTIHFEKPAGHASIQTDPYRIRQILVNLITNAIHACAYGGHVTLALQDQESTLTICITDTGAGIPGENLKKIFEPFFSTKPPGQGTGLGLFVTCGIIDKLGGAITVDSTVDQGATFCVTLPKKPPLKNAVTMGKDIFTNRS